MSRSAVASNIKRIVKCPHCGYEYDIAEVVYPGEFLGKPDKIVKDALGKILLVDFEDPKHAPEQSERYICDSCNKTFVILPQISFEAVKEDEQIDFSQEFASLL